MTPIEERLNKAAKEMTENQNKTKLTELERPADANPPRSDAANVSTGSKAQV